MPEPKRNMGASVRARLLKLAKEQIMLLDRLGQAYTTYSLGTWRLLPLIY
jgi:protein-S-isoprenylcysteine O-methyltransferase Ste14